MPDNKNRKAVRICFSEHCIPEYKESITTGKKYVNYGIDNKYPNYLLELFKKSPKHGSIIKNKAKYIAGKGLEFKDKQSKELADTLKSVNRFNEPINKVLRKASLDLEIHNGFYLQIIWGKGGMITDVIHLDYHRVRSNEDNSKFYYKKDWTTVRGVIKEFDAFNPDVRKGTQIIYFREYDPCADTYTLPEYTQCLEYIEADILVSGHVMNNAKSGFTASKLISFNDGEPENDEEGAEIEKDINDKFTGKKGRKLIVSFTNGADNAPTVLDLGASDLTKEDFSHVDDLISQNIFTGHQITSPMLFGVRVEGQLGGRSEMRDAYEMFKNTYINDRQQKVEEVFNTILEIQGLPECRIVPVEPVGYGIDEIKDYAPKAYIMEKIGINPADYPEDKPEGKPEAQQQQFSDDEYALKLFSEFGEPRENYLRVKSKVLKPEQSEFEAFREAFAEITQLESNMLDLIRKDKRATPEVIAKALQVDADLVKKVLGVLQEKGMIKISTEKIGDEKAIVRSVTEGGKQAIAEKRPMTHEVFIKYSYEGIKDERNRDFCRRMLELDKVYSRAEIEVISQRLGYSVWERRGGWYHNPNTGKTTPYCRHHWSQHIVISKK
jgi:DNA-binding MarR family transcriptional regulator